MSEVPPSAGLVDLSVPSGHDSARFDAGVSAEAESVWGKDGTFILLHPTIDGHDVGWFIFDTGATGCTMTADAARQAGLPAIGAARLQGEVRTTVYRAESLRVGPLAISGLNLSGLNMSRSASAFGRPIAGILGRNVYSSAIVEIDGPGRTVRFHDPGVDRSWGVQAWVPIEVRSGLPHVRCQIAGVSDGVFMIDSGSDATVHFFANAIKRHGLSQDVGVRMSGSEHQITFGSLARVDSGTVESFRVGEQQFGPLMATFARPDDSLSKTMPGTDGLIGMGLMRGYRVFLDATRGRVAFVSPKADPNPTDR